MKILVLNAGSSSQKSCLYDLGESLPDHSPHPLWEASIDWSISQTGGELKIKANGQVVKTTLAKSEYPGITSMLQTLTTGTTQVLNDLSEITVVGHRVVHGGDRYGEPVLITSAVRNTIEALIPLAPNHNPAHLAGIDAITNLLGEVPQVAVFDTAFHRTLPAAVSTYALPTPWREQGIRRYGFHGISHQYCAEEAAVLLDRPLSELRLITCHLGNGCSLAAIKNGQSVNTTMGFTPLEGLVMGTRCGSIDPAIPLYLMREGGLTVEEVDRLLNKQSGLQGLTGGSGDMRTVYGQKEAGNPAAVLAFDVFIHRLQSAIASFLPDLGGLDGLIFAGGIGENHGATRTATCAGLSFLGVELDETLNAQSPKNTEISTSDSVVRVLLINTDEDWAIARSSWRILGQ
ncbi:MAG: acetate kinase [Cyanobacteria bacterium P01_H01_bin.15]